MVNLRNSWTTLVCACLSTAVLCAQPRDGDPELQEAIQKAGTYVLGVRGEYSKILGVEHYQQTVRRSTVHRGSRSRHIESEVFFTEVGQPPIFITARSARRVDGRSVPGAHQRITDVLSSGSAETRQSRLTALAAEGARYNLGAVGRTFNDPTLALMFVGEELRSRFRFFRDDRRTDKGQTVTRLRFQEVSRPSLIRDERDDIDADIKGWMDVADDGRVLQTELSVAIATRVVARVRVDFAFDQHLGMLVPVAMNEDYRNDDGSSRGVTLIACTARYSSYRRFDSSIRILPQ